MPNLNERRVSISSKSLVSVVIPVCDRPEELRRAIASVLAQTYQQLEVLVVENNSKDPEVVRRVAESFNDPRISFLSANPCANANVARNLGAERSKGDYVAYLDSDDEYRAEHLENCLRVAEQSGADLVYGAAVIFNGSGYRQMPSRDFYEGEHALDFLLRNTGGFAPTPSLLVRRDCFTHVSWDESLARHQDFDYFFRMSLLFKLKCNPNRDVIIHWKKGERRSYDPSSIRSFYRRYKNQMSNPAKRSYLLRLTIMNLKRMRLKEALFFARELGLCFMAIKKLAA